MKKVTEEQEGNRGPSFNNPWYSGWPKTRLAHLRHLGLRLTNHFPHHLDGHQLWGPFPHTFLSHNSHSGCPRINSLTLNTPQHSAKITPRTFCSGMGVDLFSLDRLLGEEKSVPLSCRINHRYMDFYSMSPWDGVHTASKWRQLHGMLPRLSI